MEPRIPRPAIWFAGSGDRRLDTSAPQRIPDLLGRVRLIRQHPVGPGPGHATVPPDDRDVGHQPGEGARIVPLPGRGDPGDGAASRVRREVDLVVTPPRLRPKPSRTGTAVCRRDPCHSTDPPMLLAGRMGIVQHGRRQHPGGDVSRRLVPYTGAMMMCPDHRDIHPQRPLAVIHGAAVSAQLAQHPPPRPVP